jgi:hypothetical protein
MNVFLIEMQVLDTNEIATVDQETVSAEDCPLRLLGAWPAERHTLQASFLAILGLRWLSVAARSC